MQHDDDNNYIDNTDQFDTNEINIFIENDKNINADCMNDNDTKKILNILKCLQEIIDVMDYKIDSLNKLNFECHNSNLKNETKFDVSSLYFLIDDKLRVFKKYEKIFKRNLCLNCIHEFETDYIDDCLHECKKIIYCKKCEMDKSVIDECQTE